MISPDYSINPDVKERPNYTINIGERINLTLTKSFIINTGVRTPVKA